MFFQQDFSLPYTSGTSLFSILDGKSRPSSVQPPSGFFLTLPAAPFLPLLYTHTNTTPLPCTPYPQTPPPGLAPEHIDSAVYLITAHNLFISPPWKRAAAVTQHTTRGLEEGYWGRKLWRGRGLKLEGKTDYLMAAVKTITPHRASCWTCFAPIVKMNK